MDRKWQGPFTPRVAAVGTPQGCQSLTLLWMETGKHKPGIPVVRQWDGEGQGLSFLDTDLTLWSSLMLPLPLGSSQRLGKAMTLPLRNPRKYHGGVPALPWPDGGLGLDQPR